MAVIPKYGVINLKSIWKNLMALFKYVHLGCITGFSIPTGRNANDIQ
jgi:hypothetical protein